jgi:hypothetical protein
VDVQVDVVVVVVMVVGVFAPACEKPPPVPPHAVALACGEGGERFADHGFVPPGVRAAARVNVDDPELAASLTALSAAARGDGHGLPIDLAFAFGEWSWQVPLVLSTLKRAGHRPGELVYLHMRSGVSAWAWPSSCDLDLQTEVARRGWSLTVKPAAYGAVARAPADGDAFAYDVLYYREAFVAFAPAGQASALAQGLAAVPVASEGAAPGEVLGSVEAPIHLVLRGRALVDPDVEAEGAPLKQLVATPAGLQAVVVPSASPQGALRP